MVRRKVDYVPGTQLWDTSYVAFEETSEAVARPALYKIFDEILVNAADRRSRT